MKSWNLKTKLFVLSLGLTLSAGVVGVVNYIYTDKASQATDYILQKSFPKNQYAYEMYLDYRRVRITLRTLGIAGLPKADADAAVKGALDAIEKYEEANKAYLALGFAPGQKEVYDITQKRWTEFKETGAKVLDLYKSGTPEDYKKMIEIFLVECPARAKAYTEAIENLHAFHAGVMKEKEAIAAHLTEQSHQVALLLVCLCVFAGMGCGWLVSQSMTKELSAIANDLAGNADGVSQTAVTLTSSSSSLSGVSQDQAAAIQQTAASIEEIRAMVLKNSENSLESAKVSSRSKTEAEKGREAVEEMITSIKEIDDSNQSIQMEMENSNRRIAEIVKIIEEIGSKTKVINEIVFQTKLLSFNASVEAARAGEYGKGFAVVAEEVGNLASMSGKAAEDISKLLSESTGKVDSIVRETAENVERLMNSARNKVEQGSQVAKNCGEYLESIVQNATHLSGMVESISAASQEQSTGVDEIAKAIQKLTGTAQVSATETESTAQSAHDLKDQVESLNSSAVRLKLLIDGKSSTKAA